MSGTPDTNLDLTQVESEDLDALAQKVESFYKADSSVKSQLAWHWERNHLMLDGKQWLVYDGAGQTGGLWRPLKPSKSNEYIPRPTTNYIFDIYQTLKSYLIKNKPRSSVKPNTQTNKDKMAAKIGNLCIEANWERLKEAYNYEYAAACLVTYGTVFKKDYWDSSSLMMAKVPRMEMKPKIDPMSGQIVGQEEIPALDPMTGEPIFDEIPLGDVNSCVVEPYRMTLDPLATDMHTMRWVMEASIQPIDLVKELYLREEEGYTGLAAELESESAMPGSMQRFYQLKNSSGVKSPVGSVSGTSSDKLPENMVVVKEYYERPSQKFPKGRLIVVANGKTLYAHDSPCEGPDLGDWHPYSDCRWELVPGRFWGKGPLDDSVEIQKQVNSIDAVIVLVRKTMAIPQKLIPLGAGVQKGEWTGRPGQEIFYRPDASGAGPSVIPPTGVDQQVFQERAQRLEDLKQISGAIDILKGDRPPGVTAASALNLLYEVGTGKLFPILDRWKNFVENSQKKQLRLIAIKYKEPRPQFIAMLRMKNTELSPESIDRFIGQDLYDNCNVVVEAGSNIPKHQAAKQAALEQAAQTGVLALEQPGNRMEYQRQMGIAGFDNDVGPDTKRAEWENDLLENIMQSPDNKPIVLVMDNHDIHMDVLGKRMKEPSFVSLPAEVQQAFMAHWQEHDQFKEQMMQAQQMQAAAMGMPPGGPGAPQGGAGPKSPSPQGPGKPGVRGPSAGGGAVKNALHQDVLTPAPLKGGA